jgi:PAS domain S-box-containing protein
MSISTYADGRFIDVNTSFLRMIGFSREELIGRTSQELRFWYDHADRQELLRQLEASDGMLRFEAFPLRTKQGEQLWTEVCAQATEMDGMPCLLIIYNEHRLRRQKQRDVNKMPGPPPLRGRRRPKQRERVDQAELQSAIAEAVSVIERTRHAFKSKELAELRRRLQGVLKKVPDFRARVE